MDIGEQMENSTEDDKNSPYYDLIQEYAMLQYNDMTDYKNRVEDFFELKE